MMSMNRANRVRLNPRLDAPPKPMPFPHIKTLTTLGR